jgi:lycopene beta-cyclase
MSYTRFLGLFLVPPLALLCLGAYVLGRRRDGSGAALRGGLPVAGGLVVLAVLATTAWDSWLIRRGVWSYQPGSVSGSLWRVPVEEFGFMVCQTAVVGLWTLVLRSWLDRGATPAPVGGTASRWWRRISATTLVVAGILGVVGAVRSPHALYLGAILAWAVLPLALQCGVGADLLRARRTLWTVALAVPVLYWWAIDRTAISLGVWQISGQHTLGPRPAGLPIEEAVFFLVTSALVVNGVLLGTDPVARSRLTGHIHRPDRAQRLRG